MRQPPNIVLACPACGALHRSILLRLPYGFGELCWTDGWAVSWRPPEPPRLTRCLGCGVLFWVDRAKQVGVLSEEGEPPEWRDAPSVEHLSKQELWAAIAAGVAESREEWIYLRLRAWWADNEPFRRKDVRWVPWAERPPEARENLRALAGLLSEDEPLERLMKAEALRELERFEEARAVLHTEGEFGLASRFIRELAEQEIAEVRLLPRKTP